MNTAYKNALKKIQEAKAKGLTRLDLRADFTARDDEKLREIPEELFALKQLETLNLSYNALTSVSDSITELQSLRTLDLGNNHFTVLPEAITRLQSLTELNLVHNRLTTLPEAITRLQSLTELDLVHNRLTTLPEAITRLRSLTVLSLGGNLLTTLPEAISKLQSLTELDLRGCQLTTLPEAITRLPNFMMLDLRNNPIKTPPPEVVERGIDAIRDYFRQIESEGMDHLYEAKLLILGEGGAGKTTFANKIVDPNCPLDEQEKSTDGIAVTRWDFPMENGKPFRVNIWDFGGQEIYHTTHQFFLTKRSLYTLVADTREQNTNFYYWLNVVELLSDNSPLLIIQNEKQDKRCEINEGQLREQFSNLKETLRTNLADNRGLNEVLEEVKLQIAHLPLVGTPLPKTWVKVREALEADTRNHIELSEFLAVCERNGFKSEKDGLQLSGYLHDLGVCLHFQEDDLLKKTVILNPKWGTDAVYKVLDNKTVLDNLGEFTKQDLVQIWNEPEHAGMQDELLRLMIKFKLCYRIPNSQSYIAPQLLKDRKPEYAWDENDNLFLRYTYTFMPKGIVTQLIVAMHREIADQRWVWKSGVVLKKDDTLAEIVEYYDQRTIRIRAAGRHKRDLITIVAHEMGKIHDSYPRLRYNKLIPCNCQKCKDAREPHFHPLELLRQFLTDREERIQCAKSYKMVDVRGLIDDVMPRSGLAEDVELGLRERVFPGKADMQEEAAAKIAYDVFLSYRRQEPDRTMARGLLQQLQADGYRVAIDERDFAPQLAFLDEMERCVKASRFTVAIVSSRYLQSGPCEEEAVICKVLGMRERKRRLLPLILEQVERPAWLSLLVGIDYTDPSPLVEPYERLKMALGSPEGVLNHGS